MNRLEYRPEITERLPRFFSRFYPHLLPADYALQVWITARLGISFPPREYLWFFYIPGEESLLTSGETPGWIGRPPGISEDFMCEPFGLHYNEEGWNPRLYPKFASWAKHHRQTPAVCREIRKLYPLGPLRYRGESR